MIDLSAQRKATMSGETLHEHSRDLFQRILDLIGNQTTHEHSVCAKWRGNCRQLTVLLLAVRPIEL
jgi:hypothetical protein